MDSNKTRSRLDRLQLSVLLDASLVVSVRSAARARGMTIAALVEKALEVELDGYVESGAGGGGSVAVQGSGVGGDAGRGGVDDLVSPDSRERVIPDWDAILSLGVESRRVTVGARDPLEEIA